MRTFSFATIVTAAIVVICIHGGVVRSQDGVDQPQCSATKVWSSRVTINNTLDGTGKVISNVAFDNGPLGAGNGSGSWLVDVEQKTETCEGVALSSRLVYTLSVPRQQFGSDYELFLNIGYYKFHPEAVTWPRAREICSEEDAHLLIINSEQESSVAVQLMARYPTIKGASSGDWAWVGLQKRANPKGVPHTIFGQNYNTTGFSRWSPSQPDDKNLDDYLLFNRSNGGYGDIPIASAWKVAFICEQEL